MGTNIVTKMGKRATLTKLGWINQPEPVIYEPATVHYNLNIVPLYNMQYECSQTDFIKPFRLFIVSNC